MADNYCREWTLHKIAVAGSWLHVIWIVSVIGMVLVLVFGSETLRRQAGDVYIVRTLGLVAIALVMIGVAGRLKLTSWWLKTWRGERLRPALIFLTEQVPWFAMMAVGFGLSKYPEEYLKWPSLLASVTILPVMFAIGIPWWRWASTAPFCGRAAVR